MDDAEQEAKRRKLEDKMTGAKPKPAPAPKTPPAAPAPAPAAAAADGSEAAHEPFVCDANDAVSFKLVRAGADLDDESVEPFEPEFTHQIFRDDETIFGYKGLEVNVYMQAHLFKTLIEVTYAEKVQSAMNPAVGCSHMHRSIQTQNPKRKRIKYLLLTHMWPSEQTVYSV